MTEKRPGQAQAPRGAIRARKAYGPERRRALTVAADVMRT